MAYWRHSSLQPLSMMNVVRLIVITQRVTMMSAIMLIVVIPSVLAEGPLPSALDIYQIQISFSCWKALGACLVNCYKTGV
jgi:hypothetical protein